MNTNTIRFDTPNNKEGVVKVTMYSPVPVDRLSNRGIHHEEKAAKVVLNWKAGKEIIRRTIWVSASRARQFIRENKV